LGDSIGGIMEHIKIEIKGKFTKYAELRADYGYCFYDIDDEERNYMTYIATPIIDETELARKYVVVFGNAEKLNEELEKEIVE
jgi:hypothetical protein